MHNNAPDWWNRKKIWTPPVPEQFRFMNVICTDTIFLESNTAVSGKHSKYTLTIN